MYNELGSHSKTITFNETTSAEILSDWEYFRLYCTAQCLIVNQQFLLNGFVSLGEAYSRLPQLEDQIDEKTKIVGWNKSENNPVFIIFEPKKDLSNVEHPRVVIPFNCNWEDGS